MQVSDETKGLRHHAELMEYALCDSTRNKDSTSSYYISVNKCIGLKVQIERSLVLGKMLMVL